MTRESKTFLCDANQKDKFEVVADDSGLNVAIETANGEWSEIYFSRESALSLVSFISDAMGINK